MTGSAITGFRPHSLLKNCHLQTLWTRLARYKTRSQLFWQSYTLADGDFVDLAWNTLPAIALADSHTPLLIIFHGLEGSVYSPYADDLMASAQAQGWHAVTMHFRGCSGRLNRTHRAYHSGDTHDAREVIQWLSRMSNKPLVAAGFSLGGNMLVKLLGETASPALTAAVSVSAPLALGPSSARIDQGFSKVYRAHLVGSLKQKIARKLELGQLNGHLDIDAKTLRRIVNFRTFDNLVTAPLHGFRDVDDYYESCSGLRFLAGVEQPLLIIHAADDPFTCSACIPAPGSYPAHVEHQLSAHGGHVGFVGSNQGKPYFWLSQRILSYLSAQLK
ncbi:MAG: hydrolase [Idiomarina sp.]|nr:hydrolase [Idiomarina sp.]